MAWVDRRFAEPLVRDVAAGSVESNARGEMTVPPIAVQVSLSRHEVIVGESVHATVTLTNHAVDAVAVHSPEAQSPFLFELRSAADDAVRYTWSQRDYQLRLTGGDPLPSYTPPMVQLAPGASLSFERDIAKYAVEPFEPGHYHLVVSYPLGEQVYPSQPVEMTIVVPRVQARAALVSPANEALSLAFSHVGSDGTTVLYEREGKPNDLVLGVTIPCIDLRVGAQVAGLALTAEIGGARGRRWLAWLEGDRLGALLPGMKRSPPSVHPGPTGLSDVRLVTVGRKYPDGRAVFLVAGLDAGAPAVKEIGVTVNEVTDGRTVALQTAHLPEKILARYRPIGEEVTTTLLWSEMEHGISRIHRQLISPDGSRADGDHAVLLEHRGSVLALEMAPVGGSLGEVADAVLGPTEEGGAYAYVRLSLSDGKRLAEWRFNLPPKPVDDWAIASTPVEVPRVLIRTGDRWLVIRLGRDAAWTTVAMDAAQADHPWIAVLRGGRLWAVWADTKQGFRYQALP